MTPPSAASVTSSSEAPTSSPVKLFAARRSLAGSPIGQRLACAHPRAAPDEAAEVGGLGQRTLAAWRGDLERVALAQVVQLGGHALAHRERDAVRVIDENAQAAAAEDLGEQHLDIGLGVG